MTNIQKTKLLILGSGPAGYTAALYAARANLNPLLITGSIDGGQLVTTTMVDNWPADVHGVTGPDLMARFREHAERFSTEIIDDQITEVDLTVRPFKLNGGRKVTYSCDSLIIATGAVAKSIGLPSEQIFMGRGVSSCATCDGYFYCNQDVVVVGGGNTAVEEAMHLADICRCVTIVHRRNEFRAEPILIDRLMKKVLSGKVRIKFSYVLEEVLGDKSGVSGVKLKNLSDNTTEIQSIAGVFIAIGHRPNTEIFQGQLKMENNYICTGNENYLGITTMTSVPGVFAAGDVQDHIYRQAITSASSGCMAALDARKWLEEERR